MKESLKCRVAKGSNIATKKAASAALKWYVFSYGEEVLFRNYLPIAAFCSLVRKQWM